MLKKSFKGGVHPDDKKENTKKFMIEDLPAPKELVFPVQQHIGAPSEIQVEIGEAVKVGQLIAKQSSFVSANQHSSVSGVVKTIEKRLHPNGSLVNSIVIENDEKYELYEGVRPNKPLESLDAGEIVKIVSDAGIVGMGGAAFPTHVKLSPPSDKKIEYVIINGAECEPYLTSDYRVMLENTEELIYGCTALMKALNAPNGVIAVEDNKKEAIEALRKVIKSQGSGIKVAELETKYPQGSEKHIIYSITGREVPPGGLPADVGVVVSNVDTCTSVARAIKTGFPLITRVVTVGGSAVANCRNFRVRIGTPVKDVIDAAGGFSNEPFKVLLGGPMMGIAIFSLDVPVIKGTGAIIALGKGDIGGKIETNCIRCGKCVQACPMRLVPTDLDKYCERFDEQMLEKYHITDCIECGACTYICPARKDPLQKIRVAKQKLNALKKSGK